MLVEFGVLEVLGQRLAKLSLMTNLRTSRQKAYKNVLTAKTVHKPVPRRLDKYLQSSASLELRHTFACKASYASARLDYS